ncbi:MAG: XRE family transcriptional regulator [Woeseiaceae bacterium]|nr:XRE family transcriptional regulator [Woeseiaceae bacterium]
MTKPLYFVGSALEDLRAFPRAPRREAGYQLDRVQFGLEPSDWKAMTMGKVTKSSGNVFEDLGFDAAESENLKLRAQLMRELETLIHDKRLTQSDAAELLGIHQSRVSDLVRGKIDRFSIDMLVKLLAKTGRQVEIKVKRRAA